MSVVIRSFLLLISWSTVQACPQEIFMRSVDAYRSRVLHQLSIADRHLESVFLSAGKLRQAIKKSQKEGSSVTVRMEKQYRHKLRVLQRVVNPEKMERLFFEIDMILGALVDEVRSGVVDLHSSQIYGDLEWGLLDVIEIFERIDHAIATFQRIWQMQLRPQSIDPTREFSEVDSWYREVETSMEKIHSLVRACQEQYRSSQIF